MKVWISDYQDYQDLTHLEDAMETQIGRTGEQKINMWRHKNTKTQKHKNTKTLP